MGLWFYKENVFPERSFWEAAERKGRWRLAREEANVVGSDEQ